MHQNARAYLIGGGIGSLAAAAFMIRDSSIHGYNITIFDSASTMGGSLDARGDANAGYSMRGGRMLTMENYECTWDLFKSIPSLASAGRSVFEETVAFNELNRSHAMARLVDRQRAIMPVASMGLSNTDRAELLKLVLAEESDMGATRITDWLSPGFFATKLWCMWATTFAFQPWHSAVELRRYLHRFMKEFSRIDTLAGVKRTAFNQYDSLVLPLQRWLIDHGVHIEPGCTVTALDYETTHNELIVTGLRCLRGGKTDRVQVNEGDFVFLQNGSMTDASSIGSMTTAPPKLTKRDSVSWTLWEKLAVDCPGFGNPAAFNDCVAQSAWQSFSVTVRTSTFFEAMQRFSGNAAGTGGLVTFQDSNWLMSIVLAKQPHFANQPSDTDVFWGYGLSADRIGNFVAKPMEDCNGAEILRELCGHMRFDVEILDSAVCIPCRMPYITSMFMPRLPGDRPEVVPKGSKNLALVSQFVEIPEDVVFTVEYSVRAAQMATYALLGIDRPVLRVTPHDKSLHVQLKAMVKALV